MLWVVSANTNHCKIYHYQKHQNKLTLLKELDEPLNRLKNREIISDRPGHYNKSIGDGSRGSYEPKYEPKDTAIMTFSRKIAKLLNTAKQDKLFDKVIVITDSHMLGLLKQSLDKNVHETIHQTILKDLHSLSEQELAKYLEEHLD